MARERKFSTDELFRETKQILQCKGYDAFTLSRLAECLNVSRGTIYKYYENKDELIMAYMIDEMNRFLVKLNEMETRQGFFAQFEFLLHLLFENENIDQLMEIGQQISASTNKVKEKKEELSRLHLMIYGRLQQLIQLGRKEQVLKEEIPDELILGFIFNSVAIPRGEVPWDQWVKSIEEIIFYGMVKR
ncbi:TetR/AcrR family transcriptional regulator [Thermoactinomyces vulgaris]|uniref:TetR/AcrR family transcriptional regulator n=1 Tax=Thermoactinomyces vulgaris TaxID=2026 RepID=A0ABS0QFC8_THEVU|nr:TetR/AcrR family transcriptional regulator [Thermoactinomyces vulgaris]MBH8582217.1 TetR/AcrR family transcriptional regulator [Thermoactinomyces sp. CICC 10735]MBA4550335.1 TetR/AcrR family transcriptional regulator [Thermoactinomyces vulgaris]MBA4595746.1 TetR/AcrR family transcriptional regulator [Thermoactinomyces vulgaris]MBH8587469.1 TetR/AcrR family transcriptional regulator [Thermoactinomyces vulgaris]QBK14334.1 TetR/AcrR family transcriptional regulator [Thermoactinomyces vulgaris]